jgi:hypothetical protein
MSKNRIGIIVSIICVIINQTGCLKIKTSADDLPDFEFDDNFSIDEDKNKNQVHRPPTVDFSDFDDFFIDDGNEHHVHDIQSKKKLLKNAIIRALSTKELKYKLGEVLPLLRHMSRIQRQIFSSIISAQLNGRSFTFDEVS